MKPLLTCREATALVLQGEDRPLRLGERWGLRFHLLICAACPRFVRQVQLMRGAMDRWRHYRDSAPDTATDGTLTQDAPSPRSSPVKGAPPPRPDKPKT